MVVPVHTPFGGLSTLKNVEKQTKDGVFGTASSPLHMVATEGGHFEEHLWRTFHTLGMAFLLVSGVGPLIAGRGISKKLGLNEEVQASTETKTKFDDVKGVNEAKAELEEIFHCL